MRPLSDALPKELLPLGRKTALQHIVSELAGTGITQIIFVTSSAKEAILRAAFGEQDSATGVSFQYALQPAMRGLGDAVLCAKPFVDKEESVLVALGDAVIAEPSVGGVTSRLLESTGDGLGLVVQHVSPERVSRYGIVRPHSHADTESGASFPISGIVEKPALESAPSRYAAAARYVVPSAIWGVLEKTQPDAKNEVQLTTALATLLDSGVSGAAVPLQSNEVRHDIGGFDSFYRAFVQYALADEETGAAFRRELATMLNHSKEPLH
jgi:UTP--glucose-1-phosphate uridylyltransferase